MSSPVQPNKSEIGLAFSWPVLSSSQHLLALLRRPSLRSFFGTLIYGQPIVQLSFHPNNDQQLLLTGGTDSLLNIFDTNQSDEEDALLTITNHGSSVHRAGFLSPNQFFGLSHDENLSIYGLGQDDGEGGVSTMKEFGDLRPPLDCEYVINILPQQGGSILAAGSHR